MESIGSIASSRRAAKHIVIYFSHQKERYRYVVGSAAAEIWGRDFLGEPTWTASRRNDLPHTGALTEAALKKVFADLPPHSDRQLYPSGIVADSGSIYIEVTL